MVALFLVANQWDKHMVDGEESTALYLIKHVGIMTILLVEYECIMTVFTLSLGQSRFRLFL